MCSRLSALGSGGRSSGPQSSFCIVQPALYCDVRGNHEQGLGIGQAQTRPYAQHLNRELLKPAPHHRMLVIAPDGSIFLLDQVSRSRPVVGAHGMTYGLGEESLLGIPAAGPQVQGGHRLTFRLLKPRTQGLGKQAMVAIPASLPIQGHHKDIGTLQELEAFLATP